MSSSRLVAVVVLAVALFGGVFAWRLSAVSGAPDPARAATVTESVGDGVVGYVVSREGTILSTGPEGEREVIAHGIIFPVTTTTETGFEVLDSCNRPGQVEADQVDVGYVPTERSGEMGQSVFVIDPGHGFPDLGAVGPSGLTEAEVNIEVASRLPGPGHDRVGLIEAAHPLTATERLLGLDRLIQRV